MDALALILSLVLPWVAGCAILLAARWPSPPGSAVDRRAPGAIALVIGYGYLIGIFLLAGWMRLLSATGLSFGRIAIGAPLLLIAVASLYIARRRWPSFARMRAVATAIVRPALPRWQRIAWALLLGWLALRFATLAVEVGSRPLYPWDAWTQWATKARVWFEWGHMVPFVAADRWLGAQTTVYFDAAPGNPAAIPLLQVWSAVALGRWDDTRSNWPWLFMLLALALAIYGMLRNRNHAPLEALTAAYLVASLPLLNTHVALAGYPDLMLCGTYSLSVLALHRWAITRAVRDGVLAAALAIACPLIDDSGLLWMCTLLPGAIVASAPARGLKVLAWVFGVAAVTLLVAAGTPILSGFGLQLGYISPWRSLGDAYFLFDNWHLLWYGAIVLAVVGRRRLLGPPAAPVAMIAAAALGGLAAASMFRGDVASWFPEAQVLDRATLTLAPTIVFLCFVLWRELMAREAVAITPPVSSTERSLVVDA